ncbi:hypothetical protein [Kribbella amoyensis]|uniref:hypothetical protein n=1 Tax=Kribbella amoyensis TaxID=996641 RepID=UPI0011A226BA|nr:hypothetical protein [Kribbella amoyensis]
MRLVDAEAGQKCAKTERAVKWNGDSRRTFVVRRSAYNGATDLSAGPATLMSVMPPRIAEGTWLLTARIPATYSDPGAKITCTAQGAMGSYGYAGTFEDTDSLTVTPGADNVLELQTIAMTTRDFDTDELVPITVRCSGTAPPDGNAMIGEYQIALVPVPSPELTE